MRVIRVENGSDENVVNELNASLILIKLDSKTTFRINNLIVGSTRGWALYAMNIGFVAFENSSLPYICGGTKKNIQKLIDEGFFWTYEGMKFLIPIEKGEF